MPSWLLSFGSTIQQIVASSKDVITSFQGLVIIIATIFTARWTYKTFAHKERLTELKNLKLEIENYHTLVSIHCAQVRESKEFTNEMLQERLQLAASHNKILMMNRTNFYNRPKFRTRVQNIVGSWITKDKIDAMMNWHPVKDENQNRWKEFGKEYDKITALIDKEASRYI
jgi:hypothetical protein